MEGTRPRLNAERFQRRTVKTSEDNTFMIKTIRQLIVCIIITVSVFAVSKVDNTVCKNITSSIKNTLIYTVDYKTTSANLYEIAKEIPVFFKTITNVQPTAETPTETPVEENTNAETN